MFVWCWLTFVCHTTADTPLPSPLTGNLTAANSPYVSEEHVEVHEGGTLNIQAGTVIKFSPGKGLDVYGTINTEGTQQNEVRFTTWEEKKVMTPSWEPSVRIVDEEETGKGRYLPQLLDIQRCTNRCGCRQ